MAKAGRPKLIRNAEDAKSVPLDQAIQIELQPDPAPESPADDDAAKKAAAEAAARVAADKQDDEEKVSLKKQLADLKAASEVNERRAQEAAQREAEARKRADEREKEYRNVVLARDQAEYDAVLNAIGAAQAEVAQAEQALATAGPEQDWGTIGKAQAAISRASARLVQLEDGKAALEARAERAKEEAKNPTRVEQQSGDPVENHINSIPNLLPTQRDWLKSHRELMTDPRKNTRLQNAHLDAEDAGISAGSAAYFQFLEEKLGYKKPEPTEDDDAEIVPEVVSAPVTREPPSAGTGRQTNQRVTLTAEERAHAAASGISELDYAKNKLKLMEMKKAGHYSEH